MYESYYYPNCEYLSLIGDVRSILQRGFKLLLPFMP